MKEREMKIDQRVAVLPHQCLCRFAVRMLDSSSVVTLRLPDNCGGSSMPPEVRAFGFDALAPLPAAAGALPLMPLLPDGGLGTLGTLGSMVSADGAGAMMSVGGLDSAVVGGGQLDGLERLAEVLATALPDSLSDVLAGVLAGAVAAALTTPMDVIVTHVATTAHDGSGPPGRHPFQRGMDLIREQGSLTEIEIEIESEIEIREQGSLTLSDSCQTAVIPLRWPLSARLMISLIRSAHSHPRPRLPNALLRPSRGYLLRPVRAL
jgi:hypothetical protein